jgi:hypothetical protein
MQSLLKPDRNGYQNYATAKCDPFHLAPLIVPGTALCRAGQEKGTTES